MQEKSTQATQKKTKDTVFSFKRYEKKYILTSEQLDSFMKIASEHLIPDVYYKSQVNSIYYDTEDFYLIRHSIEGPVYKEKLRVRSYGTPDEDGTVFVELKKKFKGIVYKRRVEMTVSQAENWLSGKSNAPTDSQITREINWFLKTNEVMPRAFIGSDRTSYVDKDNDELRITIDSKIRWRDSKLSLTKGADGEELLNDGCSLMEIKIPEAAPMWLAHLLSEEKIFPTTYSKYGKCYTTEMIRRKK